MSSPSAYPHFEATLWIGVLPVPPHLVGTVVARQFETGTFGGKWIGELAKFADTEAGRRELVQWARRHQSAITEIDYIRDPRQHRIRLSSDIVYRADFAERGVPTRAMR